MTVKLFSMNTAICWLQNKKFNYIQKINGNIPKLIKKDKINGYDCHIFFFFYNIILFISIPSHIFCYHLICKRNLKHNLNMKIGFFSSMFSFFYFEQGSCFAKYHYYLDWKKYTQVGIFVANRIWILNWTMTFVFNSKFFLLVSI